MPVLGVIFLRHATNRYAEALREIQTAQAAAKMPKRPLTAADFKKRRALLLPTEARYDELLKLPKGTDLGTALVEAMNTIERDFEPLRGQLPKDYTKFENTVLEDLLRIFNSEAQRIRLLRSKLIHRRSDIFCQTSPIRVPIRTPRELIDSLMYRSDARPLTEPPTIEPSFPQPGPSVRSLNAFCNIG
jgi:hypothetical protein